MLSIIFVKYHVHCIIKQANVLCSILNILRKIFIEAWWVKSKILGYLVAIQACEAILQKTTHHI